MIASKCQLGANASKIVLLMFSFENLDDLRIAFDAFHKWILHWLAELLANIQVLTRSQLLISEEYDAIIQESLTNSLCR